MNPKKRFIIDELTPDLDSQLLAEASEPTQLINSQALVQANIQKNIVIREDLRTFIPPLLEEEYNQLEENIVAEGCRDKLIVWKDGEVFVLVDGHNRYTICNKHQIPFLVEVLPFKNIDEVQDWMINNQLGKRNVTEETKSYLRGMQYKREKQQGKRYDLEEKNTENNEETENLPRLSTRERLAIQHKVSPKTIQRDEKYVEVIDILSGGDKTFKSKILNRIIPIPKNAVDMTNNLNIEHIHKLGKLLKEGRAFKDCYRIVVAESSEKQISSAKKPTALLDVIRSIKRAVQLKDRRSYEASLRVLQTMSESLF